MDNLVCYLPAQWRALDPARLASSACAVIDVIRATSTVVSALANGATGVQPVAEVGEAHALKVQYPHAILAGERGGVPLHGFDLGNSPRDVTLERVSGRPIILTTTNGTQALAACRGARAILTASLLNLDAAAAKLRELGPPWIILCAGHQGGFGIDDALVAGALSEALDQDNEWVNLYRSTRRNLTETLRGSLAGQELVRVGLDDDIPMCAELNRFPLVPMLNEQGVLTIA